MPKKPKIKVREIKSKIKVREIKSKIKVREIKSKIKVREIKSKIKEIKKIEQKQEESELERELEDEEASFIPESGASGPVTPMLSHEEIAPQNVRGLAPQSAESARKEEERGVVYSSRGSYEETQKIYESGARRESASRETSLEIERTSAFVRPQREQVQMQEAMREIQKKAIAGSSEADEKYEIKKPAETEKRKIRYPWEA
jgi:hypothetical protein